MNNDELITILKYAYSMSRIISPMSAEQIGLSHFDGTICDFYRDIVTALEKKEQVNIQEDEFLSLVYKDMKADLGDRDIEYDGFLIGTPEE